MATKYVVDSGNEHLRAEGLGDVVAGTQFQARDDVGILTSSSHHDHRYARRAAGSLQFTTDLQTIDIRQHQIEQYQRRRILLRMSEAHKATIDHPNGISGSAYVRCQQLGDLGLILDDQNCFGGFCLVWHLSTLDQILTHGAHHGSILRIDPSIQSFLSTELKSNMGWGLGFLEDTSNADAMETEKKAEVGFEPTNDGFAIRSLSPLGHSARDDPRGHWDHSEGAYTRFESLAKAIIPSGDYPAVMKTLISVLMLVSLSTPHILAEDPEQKTGNTATSKDEPQSRPPLIAEGTVVVDIEGTMVKHGRKPLWLFQMDPLPDVPRDEQQTFILLPCRLLEEMEQKAESLMPAPARFSLSGEVLNYGNENWLLPQHVEWITDHAMRDEPDQISDDPNEATETVDVVEPVDDAEEAENRDQGDSIADIVAELQASVGPLRKSVDASDSVEPVSGPSEGRLLVSRRGRLGRGRTGAWMFVLDSDTTGLADPSLILLPSRKTAELEHYGGYGWLGRPMLISGEVFVYRGRHFVRPTAWKMV